MVTFTMEIAGYPAEVTALFASTRDYCRDYLTEKVPVFSVAVTPEDLAFQQDQLNREAREEGLRPRVFTDPFLERTAIQCKAAKELLYRNVLLTHGSCVAVDGEGFLFTAPCRTGKSTHTRLWQQVFGDRAVMVNDDKPFLTLQEEGVQVSGSPWTGKHGIGNNITVPLRGICILARGEKNQIRPMPPEKVLPFLIHQSVFPEGDPERIAALAERITGKVPIYHMTCTKTPEAAETAYRAMAAGCSLHPRRESL